MDTIESLKQGAEEKHKGSIVLSVAYAKSLSALAPANFLLVVGAALLSLVAGASILIENNLLTQQQSGILALISGALTIIHSKLGCERYQSECKKLLSFYRGAAEEYDNLRYVDDIDDFKRKFFALNDQVSAVARNAAAMPFDWALEKAKSI